MRNVFCVLGSAVAISGLCVSAASAQVLFQDDFEDNPIGTTVNAPQIGQGWFAGPDSTVPGEDIVAAPALGTRSLRLRREALVPPPNARGDIMGISLPGAIVDGNQVEVKWLHNYESPHSLNYGMDFVIGHVGSNFSNDIAYIVDVPAPSGLNGFWAPYSGPGQYQAANVSTVHPTLNTPGANEGRWDAFRLVFNFSAINATTMGGTYDAFVSSNGGPEQALFTNLPVFASDMTVADATSMMLRLGIGVSSGVHYYDDISITVVPEPAMASLGVLGLGLLAGRRRRG